MDVIVRKTKAPQVVSPPVTREVILMCEACRSFTPHQFVVTRRVGIYVFEQVYGCTCCKTERRYGLLA